MSSRTGPKFSRTGSKSLRKQPKTLRTEAQDHLGNKMFLPAPFIRTWIPLRTSPAFRKPNGPNKLFGPSLAAVTGGAVLRGTSASPRSLVPLGESGTKFDSSKLKILRWSVKACTLRAVPRCAQMGFGERNPSLNHGWVAKRPTSTTSTKLQGLEKAFPKPRPEAPPRADGAKRRPRTARSAVRSRRRRRRRRRRRCGGRSSRQNPILLVASWRGAAMFP